MGVLTHPPASDAACCPSKVPHHVTEPCTCADGAAYSPAPITLMDRHVSIDVVSDVFEGKSSMQRQRMVYKAIWMELQETVHAVDNMTTKTPAEVSA